MGVLVICVLYFEVFLTLTEVFPCFFLSCKANARVKLAKTEHGPHSSTLVIICVVPLLFVLFCVLFVCKCVLPPGDNPTAVNKHINIISKCGRHRILHCIKGNPHKCWSLDRDLNPILPRNRLMNSPEIRQRTLDEHQDVSH